MTEEAEKVKRLEEELEWAERLLRRARNLVFGSRYGGTWNLYRDIQEFLKRDGQQK